MKSDADTTPRVMGKHGPIQLLLRVLVLTLEKGCPDCGEEHIPPFATHAYYATDASGRAITAVGLICNGCNEWTMYL